MNRKTDLPVMCLCQVGQQFPQAWKLADEQRAAGQKNWPDWCFLPSLGWLHIIQAHGKAISLYDIATPTYSSLLAALGAWRPTQDICQFEPALYEAVCSTPLAGDLPCEVLYRLPAWCLYIETPNLEYCSCVLEGFWVHLEYDVFSKTSELWLLLMGQTRQLFPIILDIGAWPLKTSLEKSLATAASAQTPHTPVTPEDMPAVLNTLRALINLTLYMCSDEPDIKNVTLTRLRQRPAAKKVKRGLRLFPPDKPRLVKVGESMEHQLVPMESERAEERPHKGPRPHVRRAHWHHYWTGSRQPKMGTPGQELALRWVSAHMVGKTPAENAETGEPDDKTQPSKA